MTTRKDQPEQELTRTMTRAQSMLTAGTVLSGRYRIDGIAGAGGMGVVYKAHDQELNVDIAIKLLGSEHAATPEAMARFRQEIRLSRQVTHPNVVRIHDIGIDGDLLFLTMDYVEGRTLRERLSEGKIEPVQAVKIAIQLAEALAEAHTKNIVHRDIKPSNILINEAGRAWLTDFGIARSIDQEGMTRAGEVIGTMAYLSPEQVRGESVDNRTDLYALGLVLSEMLTGQVPLKGKTAEETLARRATGQLPTPLPGAAQIPKHLQHIIRRCLAPDPADRYTDAHALMKDLRRGHAGMNWRGPLRVVASAAALTTIVAALWLWQPWSTDTPRSDQPGTTLAVLPVINATGDPSLDWVRRSLAESIAAALAESRQLQVTEPIRVSRALSDLRLNPAELDQQSLRQLADLFSVAQVIRTQLVGSSAELRLELSVIGDADSATADRIRIETDSTRILAAAEQAATELINSFRVTPPQQAAAIPVSNLPEALDAFDTGIGALAAGNAQSAIAALEQAVAYDPNFGLAWLRLADAYIEAGFFDRALDASERAVDLVADHGGRAALWARARLAALSGQSESAVALFQQLVEEYPGDMDARLALADLQSNLGQLETASQLASSVTADDPNHPRAWFLLGKFAVMSGNVRIAADDYLTRALVIQNRLSNPEGRAEVLNGLGIANERLGELALAADYYQQAIELHDQSGDRQGLSASLSNLARLSLIQGEFDGARQALERAMQIREAIGDLPGLASLYNDFGALEEEVGNYPGALDHFRNALRLHEDLGNQLAIAGVRTSLGFTYLMLGQYDNSEVFITRAIETQRESNDELGLMSSLQILGELQITRGDWEGAQQSLLQALTLARELGSPFGEATIQGSIGRLAGYQGRISAALDAFDSALQILQPLNDQRGLAEYHLRIAELLQTLGLSETVGERLEQARSLFGEQLANRSQRARLIRATAALSATRNELETARTLLAEAAQVAQSSGNQLAMLQIEMTRLQWFDDELDAYQQLSEQATRLDHRPLRLAALSLLAEEQIAMELTTQAQTTLRSALRPPLELDPWLGNWKLYALSAAGNAESAAEAENQADALLQQLTESLPESMQPEFRRVHEINHSI